MRYYHETAGGLEDIGKALGAVATPALSTALSDPKTRSEIQGLIREALQDPQTRQAARSYFLEASAWIAGGVFAGFALYRALSR